MNRKDLILRAIKRAELTIETCSPKPGDKPPKTENDRKVWACMAACVENAKGRIHAYNAVLAAMDGKNRLLELDASY